MPETNNAHVIIPTILCGGAGSRLWPVSRVLHPKPFMRLKDGQSLIQKAFLRGARLPGVKEVLTVTNRELFFKTEDDCRTVSPAGLTTRFILEPVGRNTAAAVAAAALTAQEAHGPHAILLILAADHLIADEDAFASAVSEACARAANGELVTFGIRPTAPETGYGYLEMDGNRVARFVEKPDLETAQGYVQSGRYLWNSGMFCFEVQTILREMEQHCPDILEAVRTCVDHSIAAAGAGYAQLQLDPDSFARVPDDSLDYAVMEKSNCVGVVPCDIGWSDIGSWSALAEIAQPDAQGNRIEGEAILHDTANCFVQSPERLVGLVGVKDLIVIDTPDALLVADRRRSQDVKHVYAQLKAAGHDSHKTHTTVHRPWGTYTVLEDSQDFKIKRIVVKPKASLSLQMHHHRSEHWIVVSGTAKVVNGDEEIMVFRNESTYIPAGHKHRLVNPGIIDLVMIEVQSGQYLGEDDITRFEDSYGRV